MKFQFYFIGMKRRKREVNEGGDLVQYCSNCTLDKVLVPDKKNDQAEMAKKARLNYTANFKQMDLVKMYPKMLEILW